MQTSDATAPALAATTIVRSPPSLASVVVDDCLRLIAEMLDIPSALSLSSSCTALNKLIDYRVLRSIVTNSLPGAYTLLDKTSFPNASVKSVYKDFVRPQSRRLRYCVLS
jgi:hypothetical protein